jgi:hypothetical protein
MCNISRFGRVTVVAFTAILPLNSSAAGPDAVRKSASVRNTQQAPSPRRSSDRSQTIDLRRIEFQPVDVDVAVQSIGGEDAVRVTKKADAPGVDRPTFARLKGVELRNGTIELKVRSHDAGAGARGFIGVAFRIDPDNSRFECLYLRPGNARVDDQVRRNHTLQYYAYPDFPFAKLRQESPGKYESYADMALDEWIEVKLLIDNAQARLFIGGAMQPALVVTDLKLGGDVSGGVALWVDLGTEGYFADVKVTPR